MLKRILRVLREEFPAFLDPRYFYWLYRRMRIQRVCVGYSERRHWAFWKRLLRRQKPKKILILGVYFGRDIAYLLELSRLLGQPTEITGVDKFEDAFCDDWPEELRGKNWEQAGFGRAPSLGAAQANLARLGYDLAPLRLIRSRAEDFLKGTSETFDFIYIDTAHDYNSTVGIIGLSVSRLNSGGRIGGDDFTDIEAWGVKQAIVDCFSRHEVFLGASQIWTASPQHWRGNPGER